MEHFRGVVWNKPPKFEPSEGKKLHRYVVIGVLLTDRPIPELTDPQYVLDGHAAGMQAALAFINKRASTKPLGTADKVLTTLNGPAFTEVCDPPDTDPPKV